MGEPEPLARQRQALRAFHRTVAKTTQQGKKATKRAGAAAVKARDSAETQRSQAQEWLEVAWEARDAGRQAVDQADLAYLLDAVYVPNLPPGTDAGPKLERSAAKSLSTANSVKQSVRALRQWREARARRRRVVFTIATVATIAMLAIVVALIVLPVRYGYAVLKKENFRRAAVEAIEAGEWAGAAEIIYQLDQFAFNYRDVPDLIAEHPELRQALAACYGERWQTGELFKYRTLGGHTGAVNSVAFSPDRVVLASGSNDNTVRLWRVADGKLLRTLAGHTEGVRSVAFSPDGSLLASGSDDNTVRLWRVDDGTLLHSLEGHTAGVNSVAFSPEGATLASGSDDKTVRLWRITDGMLLRTLEGHTDWVQSVAFSPDGAMLASGSDDKTVRLWRVADGALVRTLKGHALQVWSVAFSPDGDLLASASDDDTVRVWRVSDGTLMRTLKHTSQVHSVAFSADGRLLASGSEDNTLWLWGIADQSWLSKFSGDMKGARSISFSSDGSLLILGSEDGNVWLWQVADSESSASQAVYRPTRVEAEPTPTSTSTPTPRRPASTPPTSTPTLRPPTPTGPTPTPTRRRPTPTPTPPSGMVTAETLNVRKGPGTVYPTLGKLSRGDRVILIGRASDWWKVRTPRGGVGWVAGDYVRVSGSTLRVPALTPPPTPPATPTPQQSIASNVRDFSGSQGANNWEYLMEEAGRNSGWFRNMPTFDGKCWRTGTSEKDVRICQEGEVHPGITTRIGYQWRSTVSRRVTIQVHAHKVDTRCGDGVWVGTYKVAEPSPPQKLGDFAISGADNRGKTESYVEHLDVGNLLLVLVDIRGDSVCDMTRLYIDVY